MRATALLLGSPDVLIAFPHAASVALGGTNISGARDLVLCRQQGRYLSTELLGSGCGSKCCAAHALACAGASPCPCSLQGGSGPVFGPQQAKRRHAAARNIDAVASKQRRPPGRHSEHKPQQRLQQQAARPAQPQLGQHEWVVISPLGLVPGEQT